MYIKSTKYKVQVQRVHKEYVHNVHGDYVYGYHKKNCVSNRGFECDDRVNKTSHPKMAILRG